MLIVAWVSWVTWAAWKYEVLECDSLTNITRRASCDATNGWRVDLKRRMVTLKAPDGGNKRTQRVPVTCESKPSQFPQPTCFWTCEWTPIHAQCKGRESIIHTYNDYKVVLPCLKLFLSLLFYQHFKKEIHIDDTFHLWTLSKSKTSCWSWAILPKFTRHGLTGSIR